MSFFSSDVYEATFAVPLCSRFRRFLDEGEHAELSGAMVELPTADEPLTVFFDGEPLESIVNDDWPADDDPSRDEPYGHPVAEAIDFQELPGWVPLATIAADEEHVLLAKADVEPVVVAVWKNQSESLRLVNEDLDAFLADLDV